jgi:FixJ family two-component response regulator
MSTSNPCIAVVDDEAAVRMALQRLLRSAGLSVQAFASGATVLEFVRTERPDCIVLDLHMPGVNGFEVQDSLSQAGFRIPIVVITGHDAPEARARALAGGASAYLLKPVDDSMLLAAIDAAIAAAGK